jgi:hypothetical protein
VNACVVSDVANVQAAETSLSCAGGALPSEALATSKAQVVNVDTYKSNEKDAVAKPTTSDIVKAILSEQFPPVTWSQQMDLHDKETTPINAPKASPDIPGAGHSLDDNFTRVERRKNRKDSGSGSWFLPMGKSNSPSIKRKNSDPSISSSDLFPALRANLHAASLRTKKAKDEKKN